LAEKAGPEHIQDSHLLLAESKSRHRHLPAHRASSGCAEPAQPQHERGHYRLCPDSIYAPRRAVPMRYDSTSNRWAGAATHSASGCGGIRARHAPSRAGWSASTGPGSAAAVPSTARVSRGGAGAGAGAQRRVGGGVASGSEPGGFAGSHPDTQIRRASPRMSTPAGSWIWHTFRDQEWPG
jgi:hypothetical protein